MAKAKVTKKAAETEDVKFCVYIGPTIRGVVQHGSIFIGTYTEVIKEQAEMLERFPQIRQLIVPGESLGSALIDIRTPGNSIYVYNRRLLKALGSK